MLITISSPPPDDNRPDGEDDQDLDDRQQQIRLTILSAVLMRTAGPSR
jgi:hypothetical protein